MKTIKERLSAYPYLKFKGINNSEFGRLVGVSNAYISSIRKSIQPDKLEKITACFPDLNTAWLMTGVGDMLVSGSAAPLLDQHVEGDGNKFSGTGNVSDGVPAALLQQALNEITAMRELLAESTHNTNALSNRLMTLLENQKYGKDDNL